MKNITYRPEIDGLRGIAVLAVIVNHINPPWLHGGFMGVDIFFVISGYLISSNIKKSLANESFSYKEFFRRRMTRILPMQFTLIFLLIILAYFFIIPADLLSLSNVAVSSSFFVSNFYFLFRNYDYFNFLSPPPLAHMWSLSIEEQFYMVFPFFFLYLQKYKNKNKMIIFLMLILVSIGVSQYLLEVNQQMLAFYYTPLRISGLLVGILLSFNGRNFFNEKFKNTRSLIAVSFLAYSFTFFTPVDFPGFSQVLLLIGTALIINEQGASIANKVLSHSLLVGVGKISYSLYLLHLPVIVWMRIYDYSQESISFAILMLFPVATFTYLHIEQKARFSIKKMSFSKTLRNFYIVPVVLLVIVSFSIKITDGWKWRFNKTNEFESITNKDFPKSFDHPRFNDNLSMSSNKFSGKVLLVGDSFAAMYGGVLKRVGAKHNLSIDILTVGSCTPKLISKDNKDNSLCGQLLFILARQWKEYDSIIIAGNFRGQLENKNYYVETEKLIKRFLKNGKKVFFIGQPPRFKEALNLNRVLFSKRFGTDFPSFSLLESTVTTNNKMKEFVGNNGGEFIDIFPLFTKNREVYPFNEIGTFIFYGPSYLNKVGSKFIGEKLSKDERYLGFIQKLKK